MPTFPLPNGCSTATLLNQFKKRIKELVNRYSVVTEDEDGHLIFDEVTQSKAEAEAGELCDHIAYVMFENIAAGKVMEQAMMDGVSFKDSLKISYLLPRIEKEKDKAIEDYKWEESDEDEEDSSDES